MVAAIWTALMAIAPLVRFVGGSGCPAPAEAEVRLEALMPGAPAQADPDVATLDEWGDRLRVTLRRADGVILGERELDRFQSCDDLAAAIALVVATWESDVHPEFVSTLPAGAAAAGPPAAARLTGRSAFDLAAGATVSAAPVTGASWFRGLAVDATLIGGWVPGGGRPGARVALLAGTERALPVGVGEAHWRRLTAAVGAQVRWGRDSRAVAVDAHVSLLGAALSARGSGFAVNQTAWALDVGAGAGGRLWLGQGVFRPWLELGLAAWPRPHVLYLNPDRQGSQAALPRVEVLLTLGFGFLGPNVAAASAN